MITLQDLSLYLEQQLSPKGFTDYCPNGIQVEGKKEVRRIAVSVSSSVAVIEESVKRGCDVLIVHHGVFWQKDPYTITGIKKKKLQLLLSHEISLMAYHLPLDAHPRIGNNWKAALDLGMTDMEPFCLIGVKGVFPTISVKEFQSRLEKYYNHPAHTALGGPESVSSAAIVSGGAHRSIEQAVEAGVDCFITGSFDEPVWDIAHEQKIHFFALGHYATERVGMIALCSELHTHFQIPCEFIDFPNPF